ncbi:hypothetical protein [Kineosporia succinea]|uniref:Uncharacterized protein n=1 Tax=Kineosporia succinea TaxID=84632 RepID=A0ABT9P869_9ACTN|nr:hypothetical protein [Kineosporia succinea]MDP9828751.1 hypothetical protein [Kineosporia succinea]
MHESSLSERHLNVVRSSSGALLSERSEAMQAAAGNLLVKAADRLRDGDEAGARGFVERALHLPYDEFEDIRPAVWWLQMEVSAQFGDEIEIAEVGDTGWLDRAARLLSETTDPTVTAVVRTALNEIGADYQLPAREARRLEALTAGERFGREPLTEIDDPAQLAAAVLGVLGMLNRQTELLDLTPLTSPPGEPDQPGQERA